MDDAKIQNMIKLFEILDSDGDGKISYYKMNMDALEERRKVILKPVLE